MTTVTVTSRKGNTTTADITGAPMTAARRGGRYRAERAHVTTSTGDGLAVHLEGHDSTGSWCGEGFTGYEGRRPPPRWFKPLLKQILSESQAARQATQTPLPGRTTTTAGPAPAAPVQPVRAARGSDNTTGQGPNHPTGAGL